MAQRDFENGNLQTSDSGPSQAPLLLSKQPTGYSLISLVLPFLFPALGGFLYGFDIGATSVASLSIESSTLSGTDWYNLSSIERGLVESGSLYGALVGSVLAFTIENFLGRRRQLLGASLLYIIGALVEALAPDFAVLLVGRLVYGLGIGMAMHGAPLYIAETCPSQIRGTMISLKEVMIVIGMLLGYIVGYVEVDAVGGWRIMYIIAAPLGFIMCIGIWWLPPSPRWLLLCACEGRGSLEQSRQAAAKSIRRLRGSKVEEAVVEEELEETFQSLQLIYEEEEKISIADLFKGKSLRALIIGVGLVFFQQFTGQPSVLYYAATIFESAGFSAASNATLVSVILSAFKVFMTLLAVWKVDKIGRRPILLIGAGGLTISVFMLAIYYAYADNAAALAVIALFIYVGCYQVSFGPITWLILSEIFPLRTRGRAMSIAVLINFAGNAIVTFSFSPVQAFGAAIPFLAFGILGILSVVFIIFLVPETKGLSLEEIEAKL